MITYSFETSVGIITLLPILYAQLIKLYRLSMNPANNLVFYGINKNVIPRYQI